ncbi:MAG: TolC family protein [Chitinophagaceae bacterium]|nr:TolC family protein [Chitinophagaceae bacterium]
MKTILTILLTIVCTAAFSQDSLQTLSLTNFLSIVKNYHPVAKQAAISVQMADAALLSRRGAFDPVISGGGNDKTFDGNTYYRNNTTQLSIPTWYGIEIQTGIEYLSGSRFNPEATAGKTSFAGISIPLAKNLLMDKRRAALQQAKIMQQASEAERKIILNDLLLDATDAYWQWVQAYLNFKTYQDLIRVNRQRYNLVKAAFRNGDRPAIDTTEALTQLQQFEYQQNEALLLWQNAGIQLSGYLWQQNNQAYLLPQHIFPQEKTESLFNAVVFPEQELLIDEAKKNHPELEVYNFKLDALVVERKLKFQELLPSLDLKYNQLGKGYDIASTATKTLFDNNYKYGISFSMPLRLSSGRGEYKMSKLKISETRLQQNQKQTDIVNRVRIYYNRLINYQAQVALLQRTYTGVLQLQKGEEIRFFNGESSLFLVNNRENKTQDTMLKLIEAAVKYNKTAAGLQWAAGKLWQL